MHPQSAEAYLKEFFLSISISNRNIKRSPDKSVGAFSNTFEIKATYRVLMNGITILASVPNVSSRIKSLVL